MTKQIFVSLFVFWAWAQAMPATCSAQEAISPECKKGSRTKILDCPKGPLLDIGSGRTSVHKSSNIPDQWDGFLSSEACFRATIQNIDLGLYGGDGLLLSGEACLDLNITEVLWGPQLSSFSVWIKGVNFPGCLIYDHGGLEQLDDISQGTEVLIMCESRDGCWTSYKGGLFLVDGNSPFSIEESDLKELRALAICENIVYRKDKTFGSTIKDARRDVFILKRIDRFRRNKQTQMDQTFSNRK